MDKTWTWVLSDKHFGYLQAGEALHLHGHKILVTIQLDKRGLLMVDVTCEAPLPMEDVPNAATRTSPGPRSESSP